MKGKRNGTAQAALGRRAPTMKHRNSPRGGQRNEQLDLLNEHADELEFNPDDGFGDEIEQDLHDRSVFCAGWRAALQHAVTISSGAPHETGMVALNQAYERWKNQ